MQDIEQVVMKLAGQSLGKRYRNKRVVTEAMLPMSERRTTEFDHPFNELFIWAVLNNMQKMAVCFWKHGEEAMAKSLFACKLLFAMANYADKRDLKDDIIETLNVNAG